MRNLIKNYTFTNGTRAITVTGEDAFTAEDIRLIINETQKAVIASSMQKDNITSVVDNVITFANTLPALATGDVLTIEVDMGVPIADRLTSIMNDGLTEIGDALNIRGGNILPTDSYSDIADKIATIIVPEVNVTPVTDENPYWHDLFVVMASVYDPLYPYMYALLLNRGIDASVLAQFVDGEVVVKGGETDEGKSTQWVVFKRSSQLFTASYGAAFKNWILGIAVYNADIRNVNFQGTRPVFLYYNSDYLPILEYTASQFNSTGLTKLITPNVTELKFDQNDAFRAIAPLSYVVLNSQQTSLTISGSNSWHTCSSLTSFTFPVNLTSLTISGTFSWYTCPSLTSITFPANLTSLTISGASTWNACTSLTSFTFPANLTSLIISGANSWSSCTSLTSFTFPANLTSLIISGANSWSSCTSLTSFTFPNVRDSFTFAGFGSGVISLSNVILGTGWKWTVNLSSTTVLSHDSIVAQFAALIDKRADGVNPSTVTCSTSSPIITGVNSQFTKIFVAGQTISIDGGANLTISTVDSDTQLTLTGNSNKTGTGLAYNIQKTLTLGATNLARVSSAEILVATNKGWTIN